MSSKIILTTLISPKSPKLISSVGTSSGISIASKAAFESRRLLASSIGLGRLDKSPTSNENAWLLLGIKSEQEASIASTKASPVSGISIGISWEIGDIKGFGRLAPKSYSVSGWMTCGSIATSDKSNLKKLIPNCSSTTPKPISSISLSNSIWIIFSRPSVRPNASHIPLLFSSVKFSPL